MGKLLGNAGIAIVLAVLYLGSGYAVAAYHGYADVVSPSLFAALGVFLVLAIMLYGSLYMAVGSACNELKDAQSLMMPVMLLVDVSGLRLDGGPARIRRARWPSAWRCSRRPARF